MHWALPHTSEHDPRYEMEQQIHHEKQFSCDICRISFPTDSILNTHKRLHENDNIIYITGGKLFKCELCGKKFVTSIELTNHKGIHKSEKPFKCDLFGKVFTNMGHLIIHERIHTGEKLFECDLCEKVFTKNSDLDRHHKNHTGEKPFKCEMCQKYFLSSSALSYHNKSAKHLMKLKSRKNTGQHFASTSFVDCGEPGVKLEIKEEETLDEDPLSINIEAENVEKTIKQEIGEEMKDTDYLLCEENSYEDIDIVEHKIEFEL